MLLPLKYLWEWLSVTKNQKALALIGATIAGLAYAGWTVFAHFNPPKKPNTYTYEEYISYLNKLEKKKETEYARTNEGEVEKRHILEIEIAAIRAKKADPKAFEDELSKIAELAKGLSNIKSDISSYKLKLAQEALEKGETATAEELFLKSYETGKTQIEAGKKQTAESAYYLGILEARKINYLKSYQYFREAVNIQPDNPSYLNAAGGMAHKIGNYSEAEHFLKRSLMEIGSRPWGPIHLPLAISFGDLATLYGTQGRYAEAESYYRRALGILERILGSENPQVAQTLNNLATLLMYQKRYSEAEPLCRRSLAINEKALGPEHPNVASNLNNLAALYDAQKKYEESEPLHKRSLAIWEKALGPEHPAVASSLNNSAEFYRSQGKYHQAEPLYWRALAINEKALGPKHKEVAINLNNLALLFYDQEKYREAEPLLRRSLAIREKALGPEHPDVANSLGNYAALLKKMGREAEAVPLEARAQAIREKHTDKNSKE